MIVASNRGQFRSLLIWWGLLAVSFSATAQQAYVDPGVGVVFKDGSGLTVPRFNVGAHNVISERFGAYMTLETRKAAPGETSGYFRDIFGVSARVYKMIELYAGAGMLKNGFLSEGFKLKGVRKEIGVSAHFEKIKLSVDLGYSRSNGPSLNVGYAIPLGGKFSRGPKHDHKLHFPLETIYAEIDRNHFRELLSKVTISVSTGTGRFFFKHKLEGVGIYQSDTLGPLLVRSVTPRPTSGASEWITGTGSRAIPTQVAPGEFITKTDTSFVLTSRTIGVPLNLQASVRIKAFTAGIGVGLEFIDNERFTQINSFQNANDIPFSNNIIRSVPLSKGTVSISKFYGYGGYDFYFLKRYVFKADAMIGQISVGQNFNAAVIKPGLMFNAGLNIRRNLSEYLSVFVRPSLEQKSYILNSPETGTAIRHRINSVYLNFGINFNLPPLPRCYITACRTQIDHPHGNREYRSRVHPITQKQNPGYGENKVRVKPNRVRTRKDGAVPR